jgi:hypothetical protein
MREPKKNGKSNGRPTGPDAETRALNDNPEFQQLMAEGDQAIKEGRTRPAREVFNRQRERRRAAARAR